MRKVWIWVQNIIEKAYPNELQCKQKSITNEENNVMKRKDIIKVLCCISNEVVDNLPKMLEPLAPYGKSIGILVQSLRNGMQKIDKDRQDELKEELRNMVSQTKIPKYMSCVMFTSPRGYVMSEEQQENLNAILMQEFVSLEEGHLALIAEFIRQYMGGNIEPECEDEYSIGKDYLCLNFVYGMGDDDHLPYDEQDMKLVMESLNVLLGEEVFNSFIIDGYDWE